MAQKPERKKKPKYQRIAVCSEVLNEEPLYLSRKKFAGATSDATWVVVL
jgi:hypothetical protein